MSHWKDVAAYIKDTSTTRHKQDRPELLPRLLIPFQRQISQKKIANKKNWLNIQKAKCLIQTISFIVISQDYQNKLKFL